MNTFEKSFLSEQKLVSSVVTEVLDWLRQQRVLLAARANTEIVLSEILNNVIEHGYKYSPHGEVDLYAELRPRILAIQVTDKGCEFTGFKDVEMLNRIGTPLVELPEGGFGSFLIVSLTKNVCLQRVGDENILKFEIEAPLET